MYIQSVVETHEQSLQEFDLFKTRSADQAIINSVSKLCSWPTHSDQFSLKFAFTGVEYYCLNRNRIPVGGNQFLVVNAAQPYSSFIRSSEWVNSFSIYVSSRFFNQVVAAYALPESELLDNPHYQRDQSVWFFDQLYTAEGVLNKTLSALKQALETNTLTGAEQEEYLHQILSLLLKTYQTKLTQNASALPCVKRATRLELYRRLHLAREYMDDQATATIRLEDIAQAAMLSKNHLLRHFKSMFGCSPQQYIINRRMERAQDSLRHSERPIQLIALDQGFECPSAFGRRFRALFSVTPSEYRQQGSNR